MTMPPPMVEAILGLRSTLHPVTDELRKRVQSIRVRSLQELNAARNTTGSNQTADSSWRNRHGSTASPMTNRWRQGNDVPTPLRFSNTAEPGRQSREALPGRQSREALPSGGSPRFQNSSSTASLSSLGQTPNTPSTPARYVSRFHNGSKTGDDQILNTVILNKLNVFSIKTYDDVKQFLLQILGTDQKFVREFTWLVFRKAAAEEKFCGLFAKLLSEIQKEHPVILEEMRNLHTTYLDIWDVSESSEITVDRRCRLGYSQFLAELTALGVLESDTMKKTLGMLKQCIIRCLHYEEQQVTVEEYMDCLRQLCGSKVPKDVRLMIREMLVEDLNSWISESKENIPGMSSKSKFACMDLRDLLMKTR